MRLLLTILIAASFLYSQDKPAEPKQDSLEAVIIPVKTLSGDSFNRLAKMLSVFNVRYVADDKLRTIIVYAPKDVVEQMRRVISELDRPGSEAAIGRNIEMTLSFLKCSAKTLAEPHTIPADLEPVARQLRAATSCKDVQLWYALPLHLQEGKVTEQSMRLPSTISNVAEASSIGQLRLLPESVGRKDSGRYVRFADVKIGFKIPYYVAPGVKTSYQFMDVGLNTAGDFMEGQKTVLGKVSGMDDDTAIFVVISLKVLD